MNKEDYFIKQFSKKSKIIGDDGAVIGKYIYSSDLFFEDVHFKRKWMSLKQIARKALLVNISDAIVMNALPKYALLNIAIPKHYTKQDLKELGKSFKKTAKKYNIQIIGGDTISNNKLDIAISIISISKNPILRSNTKKGDLLCYTNILGTSKRDLDILLNDGKISKKSKFLKPRLKPNFFYEISKYITSALDISDGLFHDLEKLSKSSKIGVKCFENISDEIGCSGEEYEILFSFNKKNIKQIKKIAKKHKVKLNIFGKAIKGQYKSKCQNHHFN